jgi:nitric oxide dioxygenase
MLSDTQQDLIKATVPVLRAHGETITRLFYSEMFKAHPELFDIFNPANQANGRQQRSLAGSILAYAAYIDRLDALGEMVERIANKHGSLEVQPEHYPIVGQFLMQAIRGTLGDAATPEILDAWGAAYEQLAAVMQQREASIYQAEADAANGWRGFMPFRVQRRTAESADMTSFLLVPEDGRRLPDFRPGQYLTVKARPPGYPHEQIRQYSLTHAPNGQFYRIAVRREVAPSSGVPAGLMSAYLHDTLQKGDTLLVHMPLGDFVPTQGDHPVVLLSGGSGITPVLAMLDHLSSPAGGTRKVVFIHAARTPKVLAFSREISDFAARRPGIDVVVLLEQDAEEADMPGKKVTGRISAELLRAHLPPEADIYCCGPPGFMEAAERELDALLIPASRRHSETFAPELSFGDAIGRPRPRAASLQ